MEIEIIIGKYLFEHLKDKYHIFVKIDKLIIKIIT